MAEPFPPVWRRVAAPLPVSRRFLLAWHSGSRSCRSQQHLDLAHERSTPRAGRASSLSRNLDLIASSTTRGARFALPRPNCRLVAAAMTAISRQRRCFYVDNAARRKLRQSPSAAKRAGVRSARLSGLTLSFVSRTSKPIQPLASPPTMRIARGAVSRSRPCSHGRVIRAMSRPYD